MLERIVLIILAALNLFLLSVVVTDRAEARGSRAETVRQVTQLLERNGIRADDGAITVRSAPPRITLSRSLSREAEMIRSMMGETGQEDLGGNILFYRGGDGQALLRGSGEIAALFSPGRVTLRGDAVRTSQRLLRRAGLDAEIFASGADTADNSYADAYCCWDGCPVFNAVLRFDYSGENLYMITGTRSFDTASEQKTEGLMDSVSALLRFVEFVNSEGFICSRLTAIRPGYMQTVVVSGESSLSPVWRITTDTGDLLVYAESGRVEAFGA